MYGKYIKENIGMRDIASIRYTDIKKFYGELLKHGFKPNSVEIIQTILHPVFNVAVKDGYIRINPTDGVIAEIKKSHDWEKPKRPRIDSSRAGGIRRFCGTNSNVPSLVKLVHRIAWYWNESRRVPWPSVGRL